MNSNDPVKRDLVRSLVTFARAVAARPGDVEVAHDLCAQLSTVLNLSGASVALLIDGRFRFLAASDDALAGLERSQESCQRGPSWAAVRSGQVVTVADVNRRAELWPEYAAHAADCGVVSVAAVPIKSTAGAAGVIGLFHKGERAWSARDVYQAKAIADIAGTLMLHAAELARRERTIDQLKGALVSRVVIEQAKGIIAQHRSVTVDEAFNLIRAHSRLHSSSLRAVAEQVVHAGLRL